MKKINILLTMIMLLAFMACDDDDYVAPNSFSDVAWYSPAYARQGAEYMPIIGQRAYFSIADISQGAIEHKWELLNPEIYFLKGDLVRNDTMLVEKISGGGEVGDISTDGTVHLYFPEGGIQGVRLYNTFEEEVFFRGKDSTISSVYDEKLGLHVFDHTFFVDVYHDVVADYNVYTENGELIDFTAADTIKIQMSSGGKLHFAQNVDSIYNITDVTWNFPSGTPASSSEDSLSVIFYNTGIVKNISLNANRSGNNIPSSSDKVIIPLEIEVVPSTEPLVLVGNPIEQENQTIEIQISGKLKEFTGQEGSFEVTVNNDVLATPIQIAVTNAKRSDHESGAFISLELADEIYNSDEITIAYTGTGIKSLDGRTVEPFTETVIMHNVALTDHEGIYGFETTVLYPSRGDNNGNGWNLAWNHTSNNSTGTASIVQDFKFSGESALKLTADDTEGKPGNANSKMTWIEPPLGMGQVVGKVYKLSMQYLYPTSNVSPDAVLWWTQGPWGANGQFTATPSDEWKYYEKIFTLTNVGGDGFIIRFDNGSGDESEEAILYVDDFKMFEYEERP
ncbi:hypothetical protein [Saccharicrinis aurantiacus]|uniref:hypothetical protein n=1 Tax=Saccharicrinis aurantiacus TaxID=1849719 RepID=UPI0009502301|nr:hypothetical protein [Saccharicrinis aurantiacus]